MNKLHGCEHPIKDYVWNDILQKLQCPHVEIGYDKGTVIEYECGAILDTEDNVI